MADESSSPNQAIDRLEAALERIARVTAAPPAVAAPNVAVAELAERLDSIIGALRATLGDEVKSNKTNEIGN
jgi:hypothetical protein